MQAKQPEVILGTRDTQFAPCYLHLPRSLEDLGQGLQAKPSKVKLKIDDSQPPRVGIFQQKSGRLFAGLVWTRTRLSRMRGD